MGAWAEPWRACSRPRGYRARRRRRAPAASSAHPGAVRRDLPRGQRPRPSWAWRAGATGDGAPRAFRLQGHPGFRAMNAPAGEALGTRLERYLAALWNAEVKVRDLARIPGGASRETYRFDADVNGEARGMILRRDPCGSLIDTNREIEFLAYKSFHGIVPVPEPLVLETEGGALERPFFIMGRIDGGQVASVLSLDPYGGHARAIGEELFRILGRIARCDPAEFPLRD